MDISSCHNKFKNIFFIFWRVNMKTFIKVILLILLIFSISILIISCKEKDNIIDPGNKKDLQMSINSISSTDANLLVLRVARNWLVGYNNTTGYDYMLSTGYTENPGGTGTSDLGQFAYLAGDNSTSTIPLWRMYKSFPPPLNMDHMVSTNPNEVPPGSGWTTEVGPLSWIWTTSVPDYGMQQIFRTFSTSNDHGVAFAGDVLPPNYSLTPGGIGYGFKRYGKAGYDGLYLNRYTLGNVSLGVNVVAGGIISELVWNNHQFINHWNKDLAGRGMQIDLYCDDNVLYNPTEAGDSLGLGQPLDQYSMAWRHGSPLTKYNNSNSKIETEVHPLLWYPKPYIGLSAAESNPVMWKGKIGKTIVPITLIGGNSQCLKWTTNITVPTNRTTAISVIEVACAHLSNEFSQFYSFYNGQFQLINIPKGTIWDAPDHPELRSKGFIISTTDGNYALGCYHGYTLSSIEGWNIVNYTKDGSGYNDNSYECSKWGLILRRPTTITPGLNVYTVYILVGTKADVQNAILYLNSHSLP
jgi:hypothetical protein